MNFLKYWVYLVTKDEDELDDDDETEDVGRMLGVGIDEEDAYIEEEYY